MKLTIIGAMAVAGFVISLILLIYIIKSERRKRGGEEDQTPRLRGF